MKRFEAGSSFEQLIFQKKNFFRGTYFLRTVTFSEKLVLRNQLHCIYTRKDVPLSIIHSFQQRMAWFDFEILHFFIDENGKRCMNLRKGCVTIAAFQKVGSNCGIFKQALGNRPNEFHMICGLKDVAMKNLIRIEQPVTFEGPTMWQ